MNGADHCAILSVPVHSSPLIDNPARLAPNWALAPQRLDHRLHKHPLLSRSVLERLIEDYPVRDRALVLTNCANGSRRWREGDFRGLSGSQVLAAIEAGSLWLNLRAVNAQDAGYQALIDQLYAELAEVVPGLRPTALKMGILISSPRAQVHYHVDLPGQGLWQIAGRKRVWLYPTTPPYLTDHALENVSLAGLEFCLDYQPGFDAAATVLDLEAGQALAWPVNAPHRIVNHDSLNISVTTEYWTTEIRRSQQVHLGNALLRRWGLPGGGRVLAGPRYWTKAALQALWRRSPAAQRTRQAVRPIDFRLDPAHPGQVIDMAPVYR